VENTAGCGKMDIQRRLKEHGKGRIVKHAGRMWKNIKGQEFKQAKWHLAGVKKSPFCTKELFKNWTKMVAKHDEKVHCVSADTATASGGTGSRTR